MTEAKGALGRLAARLAAGDTLMTGWCMLDDPVTAEVYARAGYDAVLIDLQHGAMSVENARHAMAFSALAGVPALARIPVGDYALASRLIDAGAAGIVAPMIESPEDARRFASFVKFPPLGARSWSPLRAPALAGLAPGDYFHAANRLHLAFAMIETRAALAALDEILAVDGVDGVLVGPADLSAALSNGASLDPGAAEVDRALDHVAARCAAAGKYAAAFCFDAARAGALARRGFRLLSVGADRLHLELFARAQLQLARGGGRG